MELAQMLSGKNAHVGVSILTGDGKDTLSINGHDPFPMQSVFKFHIALAVLAHVREGKLALQQPIQIEKSQLLPGLYSPLRENHPEGATLTLAEIMSYTVSQSDNVGCDVMLRLIGGPGYVEQYFKKLGFQNISIKFNEEVMQSNWDFQFQNWTTPLAATQVLAYFYRNEQKELLPEHHTFIWDLMRATETGQKRIRGELPRETVVAHKTGWSGANQQGITAAVNDIGIVWLPDGRYFYVSVFVSRSKEDLATNEKIIADIAQSIWNHFYPPGMKR